MPRQVNLKRLLSVVLVLVGIAQAAYNTSAGIVAGKLNVHFVAHSHDDVGWGQTVDQYYESSVRSILHNVVHRLQEDPNRKFVQVEQAFFTTWWKEQNLTVQKAVKKLVKSGQLDFINGGWCMHDEAATHYIDMIDQTSLGHEFLKETFGVVPRIGWQIDPFGHSAAQAYLLGTELGFDALFFARIDYQDRNYRLQHKSLEFVWEGSRTLKSDNQIFTSVFMVHYSPPEGFDYDYNGIPIVDGPSEPSNVKERVQAFVDAANKYADVTRTNHVMWTMGNDFAYREGSIWFTEMDKLIHYVNQDGRVNVLYSTPSIYLDAKYAAGEVWNVKKNDFFPYADDSNSYWTGYFSSRPAFKGYVRALSGYFQAARQLEALAGRNTLGPNTDSLRRALAVAQHHDAVSGTARQHVTNDYVKQLAAGAAETENMMNSVVSCLTAGSTSSQCQSDGFVQCPLLNISYCPASQGKLTFGKPLVITAYNPLGWSREEYVQIPVTSDALIVLDEEGKAVPAQLTPVSEAIYNHRHFYVQAELDVVPENAMLYSLVFKATVPPLGFSSYTMRPSEPGETGAAVKSEIHELAGETNDAVQQSYHWYAGYVGYQNSGAYIFRPADKTPTEVIPNGPIVVIQGPLYKAVRQQVSSWIYEEHRVYKDRNYVEQELLVGPVPVDDGTGRDVITKFKTGIQSDSKFYTDSNGRDFIERTRNKPDWEYTVVQPVAANYYPVNLGIYVNDSKKDFSVLVDRSFGASSLVDGEVELMLHRRLLVDDGRGVGEALNERVCVGYRCEGLTVRATLHYKEGPVEEAARWRRQQAQRIYYPLQLFFSTQSKSTPKFSAVKPGYVLPGNVALLTIQELEDKSILVRLAHIFDADEDPELSKLTTVDLASLFWNWEIQGLTELSLSANQLKSDMKHMKWKTSDTPSPGAKRGAPIDPKTLTVELGPMEIRTLQLTVQSRHVKLYLGGNRTLEYSSPS